MDWHGSLPLIHWSPGGLTSRHWLAGFESQNRPLGFILYSSKEIPCCSWSIAFFICDISSFTLFGRIRCHAYSSAIGRFNPASGRRQTPLLLSHWLNWVKPCQTIASIHSRDRNSSWRWIYQLICSLCTSSITVFISSETAVLALPQPLAATEGLAACLCWKPLCI